MHPHDDDYLSKMMPEFEKKSRSEVPVPLQKAPAPLVVSQPGEEALPPEPPAPDLFNSIAAYISQYLACDQHQLAILTLWVAHTWSFKPFCTAAYLNVRSPQPQSGKSTCLMLLKELSNNPSFATGVSAEAFRKYLLTDATRIDDNKFEATIFLDECHHTFGPSERQPLVALLNSGSDVAPCYFAGTHEYYIFGPKAFAGNTPLPRSLAARCIPITLRRKKPSDILCRFHPRLAREDTITLVNQLISWARSNRSALEKAAQTTPPRIPPGLTPREQACAEPLLHLADLVGGSWPEKARTAINNVFQLAEETTTVELLCDIRDLFYSNNDSEYLSTQNILTALRELEHRPWSAWGRSSGKKLGTLLHPLGITSRYLNEERCRGYYFKHFQDAWERYIPPAAAECAFKNPSEADSDATISSNSNELLRKSESGPISPTVY